ncbi:MAG: tryptophan 2,3-dioxygenase [Bacteroidia bacterium]
MNRDEIVQAIVEKYEGMGEDPNTYLQGLLHSKLINYWDYIEVDTLLSLQKPRTPFADEEIFIIYHQVTELVLKLIMHEIKQITGDNNPSEEEIIERITRANRYTTMLITSFAVMKDGMSYEDYNTFRVSLAPASGFQSAQFRFIEIRCTKLENLVNAMGKQRLPENPTVEDYFEHVYWKDAGLNRKTGKKTLTLSQFEDKYLDSFIELAKEMAGNTLEEKVARIKAPTDELLKKLKYFDKFYNIEWPKTHLNTAKHYLDAKGEEKAATGGSDWKKYLHPMYQQRKFFPGIYTQQEIENWGKD